MKNMDSILDDWKVLNQVMKTATEEQAKELLDYERTHKNRITTMRRIHNRYNLMRGRREKQEMMP